MSKKIKLLTMSLIMPTILFVGYQAEITGKAASTQTKKSTVEDIAKKNRKTYLKSVDGVKRKDINLYDEADLLKPSNEGAAESDATILGLIVKTSFNVENEIPVTKYSLYVKNVYHGDKSLVGKTIELGTLGGKINNLTFYNGAVGQGYAYNELTPEELKQDTIIKADGADPAAPGDEIVAIVTRKEGSDKCQAVSKNLIFYKKSGEKKFKMHRSKETLALCGNSTEEERKVAIAESKKRHFEKEKEKQKIEQQVNKMVKTKKDLVK